ncbi:hypothetical protein [Janthinobacterium sp. B9-8]|uniref:hypothetical protein n=1 Tax=Janthinobacterium sp. B9-8 TaxID=1236179 RepID=UPI00061CE869|nr:hypothetical protein [Janthinobacterium sp. B9-8]AMC34225.1 hypothetical protein VN23_06260 [Janthinobacterium sp. B9-8]
MLKKRLQKDTNFKLHIEQARIKSRALQLSFSPPTVTDADLVYYSTFIMGFECFNQTDRASRFLQARYYRNELNQYVAKGQWPKPRQRLDLLPWFALAFPDFPLPVSVPKIRVPQLLALDTSYEERVLFANSLELIRKTLRKAELKRLRLLKKKKAAKAASNPDPEPDA